MDQLWVVIWLAVFAVVTGLAGFLLYQNRKKRLESTPSPSAPSDAKRPHGHHRPGH
jgi:cytoskeletal protein RodZ